VTSQVSESVTDPSEAAAYACQHLGYLFQILARADRSIG